MVNFHTNSFAYRLNRKIAWPDPELSIGTWYRKMGRHDCWEAVGPARDTFTAIGGEIKAYLEKHSEPVQETVTWSIYMTGKTRATATPRVMFCSPNMSCAKAVKKMIRDSGILDPYPGVTTGHSNLPPDVD